MLQATTHFISENIMGYTKVNGAMFYYEIAGNENPETLVMLHAGVADSRMWDDQFAYFAEHYRVIRFDWRGYGKTEMVEGAYTNYTDLYGLFKALDIDHAILLGCSMGGAAAIDFAISYPQMVDKLILVGSAVSGYEHNYTPPQWEDIEIAYDASDMDRCSELFMEIWLAGQNRKLSSIDPQVRARNHAMNLIWLATPDGLGDERDLDPPALHRLGEIRVPTLVMVGECDVPWILDVADLLADGIQNARKMTLHNTAHLPSMEHPDLFNWQVAHFLAQA